MHQPTQSKLDFSINDDNDNWWEDSIDLIEEQNNKTSSELTSSQEDDDRFLQILFDQDDCVPIFNEKQEIPEPIVKFGQSHKDQIFKEFVECLQKDTTSKGEQIKDNSSKIRTQPKDINTSRPKSKIINPVFANRGKKWPLDEDLMLITQIKSSLNIEEIALLHKRTELSIKLRLCKYGLVISQTRDLTFDQISKIIVSFQIEDIFFESTEKCQPTFAEIEKFKDLLLT